jgi:heme/copper-type cytochrome/quinol oxidase subunit 4
MSGIIGLALLVILYVVPAITALSRNHKNQLAIVMLNIFVGWTFIGWVVALVWSCTDNVER